MRTVTVVLLLLSLSGCGHPPAYEMASVRIVLSFHWGEQVFHAQHGRFGQLWELHHPSFTKWRAAVLEGRPWREYHYRIHVNDQSYSLVAIPESKRVRRSFFIDETGVLRQEWEGRIANATSPEIK